MALVSIWSQVCMQPVGKTTRIFNGIDGGKEVFPLLTSITGGPLQKYAGVFFSKYHVLSSARRIMEVDSNSSVREDQYVHTQYQIDTLHRERTLVEKKCNSAYYNPGFFFNNFSILQQQNPIAVSTSSDAKLPSTRKLGNFTGGGLVRSSSFLCFANCGICLLWLLFDLVKGEKSNDPSNFVLIPSKEEFLNVSKK